MKLTTNLKFSAELTNYAANLPLPYTTVQGKNFLLFRHVLQNFTRRW